MLPTLKSIQDDRNRKPKIFHPPGVSSFATQNVKKVDSKAAGIVYSAGAPTFTKLGIMPSLQEAASDMGWTLPTPIQSEVIPAILKGEDVVIVDDAKSGKTSAVSLAIMQLVWDKKKREMEINALRKNSKATLSHFYLNRYDCDQELTIGPDDLSCGSCDPRHFHGARATAAVRLRGLDSPAPGNYYFEAKVSGLGSCVIGWSWSDPDAKMCVDVETGKKSFAFRSNGLINRENTQERYGEPFTNGDIIGCFLKVKPDDCCTMWWSKNGKEFSVAYTISLKQNRKRKPKPKYLFPAVATRNTSVSLNFGDAPFSFSPPQEFIGISKAPRSSLYLNKYLPKEKKEHRFIPNVQDCSPDLEILLPKSGQGIECQTKSCEKWCGVRATGAVHTTGKYYFEVKVLGLEGQVRIGWSSKSASLDLGSDMKGYGFDSSGELYHNKNSMPFGRAFTRDDVIGCFLDIDAGEISYAINGELIELTFGVKTKFLRKGDGLFPAISLKNAWVQVNFGGSPFAYSRTRKGFIGVALAKFQYILWAPDKKVEEIKPMCPTALFITPAKKSTSEIYNCFEGLKQKISSHMRQVYCTNAKQKRAEHLYYLDKTLEGSGPVVVFGMLTTINNFIASGHLVTKNVQYLFVDKAEQFSTSLFDGLPDIKRILNSGLSMNSDGSHRQVIVCSSKRTSDVEKFVTDLMPSPKWIDYEKRPLNPAVYAVEVKQKAKKKPSLDYESLDAMFSKLVTKG